MEFKTMPMGVEVGKLDNGFGGKGDWVLLKCSYDKDGAYGEFYLNLNPKTNEGELVRKDSGYSDVLMNAFREEMK